eukprot:1141825-Pelagomonas_calceolata.AAC.5
MAAGNGHSLVATVSRYRGRGRASLYSVSDIDTALAVHGRFFRVSVFGTLHGPDIPLELPGDFFYSQSPLYNRSCCNFRTHFRNPSHRGGRGLQLEQQLHHQLSYFHGSGNNPTGSGKQAEVVFQGTHLCARILLCSTKGLLQ